MPNTTYGTTQWCVIFRSHNYSRITCEPVVQKRIKIKYSQNYLVMKLQLCHVYTQYVECLNSRWAAGANALGHFVSL